MMVFRDAEMGNRGREGVGYVRITAAHKIAIHVVL